MRVYGEAAGDCLKRWASGRYRPPPLLGTLTALLAAGDRVLDAGCGPGRDTRHLVRRGFAAVGLDRSPEFLNWARRRDPAARLVLGDLRDLPFPEGAFGGIWAAASLIHLAKHEVRGALGSLYSLTRSGGWMAATFVHGKSSGFLTRGWLPGRYFSRWTREELARAVRTAGWSIVRLECVSGRERKGRWLNLTARRRP